MSRPSFHLMPVLLIAVLSLAASGNGCGAEDSAVVDQSRIYSSYWLYFDQNANVTHARAQFRLGHALGTALELKAPAAVSFAGQPLAFNGLLQWHEAQTVGLPAVGDFSYVNTAGRTFANAAAITRQIDFPTAFPTTLDRTVGFTLTWVGPPLQQGEDVELVVYNAAEPTDFIRVDQFATGATSITVPANQLARVGGTTVGVSLRRHAFVDTIDATDAGGRLQLTWEPRRRMVGLR